VGVIDAIADGCFAVARRPWVLLPLVLLDALYWVGGRLSAVPLLSVPIALLEWSQRQNAAALDPSGQTNPGAAEVADQIAQLREVGGQLDLFELLSLGQSPLLPKLSAGEVARPWGVGVIDFGSGWLTLLAIVGLVLLGLLWFALTLAIVGMLVREEPLSPPAVVGRAVRFWGRLVVLGLVLVGVAIFLGVPLAILAGLLQLLGLNPSVPLLMLVFPLPLAWLFLSRTTDAIAVSDAGPLRAIKLSVLVVRRNFWAMLRLFAAGWLISLGFPIAWAYLAREVAGVPLAVVGNAFLNTGLLAAAMIFYRDCLAAIEQPPKVAQPPPQPPRWQPPPSHRR
jgi:hypothetical protein